jgi:hypothetical protein
MSPHRRVLVIAGPWSTDDSTQLYWSNTDGWVDLESATVFLESETQQYAHLPVGAVRWQRLPAY